MASVFVPILYAAAGIGCLVRGLFQPHRAVVREGAVKRCSGPNSFGACDPADAIQAAPGTLAYAVTTGKIVAVGQSFVHLLTRDEPVLLMYDGIAPAVAEGQYVSRGQRLGAVDADGLVRFSVSELVRSETSQIGYAIRAVPPSGWLAARGARHAAKDLGDGTKWCEGGRTIAVPGAAVQSCDLKQPEPGKFGLLPIDVSMG